MPPLPFSFLPFLYQNLLEHTRESLPLASADRGKHTDSQAASALWGPIPRPCRCKLSPVPYSLSLPSRAPLTNAHGMPLTQPRGIFATVQRTLPCKEINKNPKHYSTMDTFTGNTGQPISCGGVAKGSFFETSLGPAVEVMDRTRQ